MRWWLPALALTLAACGGAPKKPTPPVAGEPHATQRSVAASKISPYTPALEDLSKRGDYTSGGLYAPQIKDGAPDELTDVEQIPEPVVHTEPRSRYGNRSSYSVLGKSYRVMDSAQGYVEQGIASYYGKKFHGRRTSSMEVYDMYAFSAAHKTLPLPSHVRVTHLGNGKSVVVRVNDRGPFHAGRIIDLSYAAAVKLGLHRSGIARVEVRSLSPGEDANQPDPAAAETATMPASKLPSQPAAFSAIDKLVAGLPPASADAGERMPLASSPATTESVTGVDAAAGRVSASADVGSPDWRFDMRQDGRTMNADEFDAWMRSRRSRVATGEPGKSDPRTLSDSAPSIRSFAPVSPAVANEVANGPVPALMHASGDRVIMQVAAFSARANGERALALLQGASIGNARLLEVEAEGQKLWRLRVGPVESSTTAELAARIQGLGFGPPQRVRE